MDSKIQEDDFVYVVSVSKNNTRFYGGACYDTGNILTVDRHRAMLTPFATLEEAAEKCGYSRAWGYPNARVFKVRRGTR